MGDWISVADELPEPGRPVLAAFEYPHHKTKRVIRAQWADRLTLPAADADEDCDYSEELDEYFVPPGWYETNEMEEIHWKVTEEVTHWMPLPAPPEAPHDD